MGSFFTSLSSQKPKEEQNQITINDKKQQMYFGDASLCQKQTQSIGKHILQDGEVSFNEEQFKGQTSKKINGQIYSNQHQSQEAILIDESGKLLRIFDDCQQQNFCYQCHQLIDETLIKIVCKHIFHQNCFIQIINKQLEQKDKFIIKCKCGTKLNPNILRQIVDVNVRSSILYQMFSNQVQKILSNSNIRKYCDVQSIQQMMESNTKKQDYDFLYAEKKVELQKSITEYQLDQSGILHITQQQLFIISLCLFCGNEISSTLLKLNCGHIYHQECLMNWLKFQIQEKKCPIIKCRCGTKTNPNIIRRIPDRKIRLKNLNYLFSEQLAIILQNKKKIEDYDKIFELFKINQYTEDQEYDSSSGFLYFSNYSTPGGD